MADDNTQRPFHAPDSAGRNPSASGGDPLAELARLIGQNDPFAEFGREGGRGAAAGAPPVQPADLYHTEPGYHAETGGYAGHPDAAAYAQHPDTHAHHEAGAYAHPDAGAYAHPDAAGYAQHDEAYQPVYDDPNLAQYAADDQDYYDDVPPRRRMGVLAIAAVFALAVVGTAAAVGYRALFGSASSGPPPVIKADTAPSKIVPDKKDSMAKLIQDRAPHPEKLVSREEKPVDIQGKPAGVFPPGQAGTTSGTMQTPMLGSGVIGGEPKKIHTIVIRPDQPSGAGVAPPAAPSPAATITANTPQPAPAPAPRHTAARAAPQTHHRAATPRAPVAPAPSGRNAPLSLSPDAQAPAAPARSAPMRTAATPRQAEPQPTQSAGGYAVQVSSRRSQADAQAAFLSLQAKYPNQLGGRQPLIRRVDLGQKGVYYRTMIGPFESSDAASKLCGRLKAAGGHCFVQRI